MFYALQACPAVVLALLTCAEHCLASHLQSISSVCPLARCHAFICSAPHQDRLLAVRASSYLLSAMQLEVPDQESMPDDHPGFADERPYRPLALQVASEMPVPPQLVFRRFGIQDMGRPTHVAE